MAIVAAGAQVPPPVSRVLIVSPNAVVAHTLARMLRFEGFEVWTASSENEGLMAAFVQRPQAIFVELRPSEWIAAKFVKDLKGIAGSPSVTIMSGDYYLADAEVERIKEAGAELRFMPLWLDELLTILGRKPD